MAHGINIQAICENDCHFTFFGVIAPGKASHPDHCFQENFNQQGHS
jgi:hypothetical protein